MALLTFSNLGQRFGDFDLFSGASGSVPHGGKVGIVGPNGVGKTTLLRILAGLETSAGGSMHFARGTELGYLRQEATDAFAGRDNTLYAELLTVFADLRAKEADLRLMEQQMAAGDFDDELFDAYSRLQTRFEMAGGYDYDVRIRQVLTGLGFEPLHYDLPLAVLSGGQKTRALLARLLLERPDILFLDEPTNHLDIAAVEWLEGTLKTWEGAVLIVSHDRYFLDRIVDTIWELSQTGIEAYRGNYSHYVTQRQERWERRQIDFDTLQQRFFKELDYIKRNIARASTTNMAVGRLKRLIREVKMAQQGGSSALNDLSWAEASAQFDIAGSKWEVPDVEAAIKALPRPSGRWNEMAIRLRAGHRSGNVVLRTSNLTVGYPGNPLFRADDIELFRQEVAALIGPNGAGKTTFLRTILAQHPPLRGNVWLGASLEIGYFAQAHEQLARDKTVLDALIDHSNMLLPEARNYLGRFLFRGDDVFKPIGLLSGGERGRLALALLAFEKANFLLMDEPTNHLDIPAQEALETAIGQYDGTILMVSHDRYLIDRLATQIWELRDGRLYVYKEGYQAYLAARAAEQQAASTPPASPNGHAPDAPAPDDQPPRRSKNEQMRFEKRLGELEAEVHRLEAALEAALATLEAAGVTGDYEQIQQATSAYAVAEAALHAQIAAWELMASEA